MDVDALRRPCFKSFLRSLISTDEGPVWLFSKRLAGLRHFEPGRFYDMPVREGWLSRPLSEDESNPFSVEV
jgi:hypothetical protein